MADLLYFEKENTGGRPKLILNDKGKKFIEDLSSIGCTDEEIASMMSVSVEALLSKNNKDTFTECKYKGFNKGKASLRRRLFEMSMKGNNASVVIFMAKNWLGMVDKIEQTNDEEVVKSLNDITEAMKKIRGV